MPNDSIAIEDPAFAAQSEALAASRAESAAREKSLKKKGRLPGQQHIPPWQFMVVGLAAVINDGIDLVEIPAIGAAATGIGVVLTVAVKVGLVIFDAATAFFIMAWSFFWGKGFFSARRIATFLATMGSEMFIGTGVIPGWTLYVVLEYVLQKGRETIVKGVAKVSPKYAAKAAVVLEAGQKAAEMKAAGFGKGIQAATAGLRLRGTTGAVREAALAARGEAGKKVIAQTRQMVRELGEQVEQYAPGYGPELVRDIKERVAPASQEAARKMGEAIQQVGKREWKGAWQSAMESKGALGKVLGEVPTPKQVKTEETEEKKAA